MSTTLSQSPADELGISDLGKIWDEYVAVAILPPRVEPGCRGQWWIASWSERGKFYRVTLNQKGRGLDF